VEQAIEAVKAPSSIMRNPQNEGNHGGLVFFVHMGTKWLLSQRSKDMSAGSSQDTGRALKGFLVASTRPPIVEIDTEATATYVRFGRGEVVHTEPYGGAESLVMVDYDKRGRVLGIEFIGRKELNTQSFCRRREHAATCIRQEARENLKDALQMVWNQSRTYQ